MPAIVIVGAQWGDEGKAKVIDLLAEQADCVVRYQGGCNAGHTVVRQGETFKFHLVPSGILYPGKTCIIGPGTVIAPEVLKDELDNLHQKNIATGALYISPRAHVTLPHHMAVDGLKEDALGDEQKIGTTRRGIGPTYEDKVGRIGLRVGDLLLDDDTLRQKLAHLVHQKSPLLEKVYGLPPLDTSELLRICHEYRNIMAPYVTDVDALLATAQENQDVILLEGAQGTMLDLDHGTYPYVTSSNPTAGGACTGSGLGPKAIDQVIGITKAYTTRVGSGPFPTELFDAIGEHLCTVGHEFGTTTGRKRRCGWFDAPAMRYAIQINSLDSLAVTKLDVLTGLSEIRICTAYRHMKTGEILTAFPSQIELLAQVEPIYEILPGWHEPISHIRHHDELPPAAKDFLARLAELCHTPVALISVGPNRDETIMLADPIRAAATCANPLDVPLGTC